MRLPYKPFWSVLHLLAIISILTSLSTGMRIAILDYPQLLRFNYWLPQGEVHTLHILSGLLFLLLTIAYCWLRRVAPQLSKKSNRVEITNRLRALFHCWQLLLKWLLYLFTPLLLISGLLLLVDLAYISANSVLSLHFISAVALLIYTIAHAIAYLVQRGKTVIKSLFLPIKQWQSAHTKMLVAIFIVGLSNYVYFTLFGHHKLYISKIPTTDIITLDGMMNEPQWQATPAVTIHTRGGKNFIDGESVVTVKALHNEHEIYMFVQWQDANASFYHLPLLKTTQGWQVQEQGFNRFNETKFYEDKFAIMLSDYCALGAAGTAHLGTKPLKDKPENWSGKGFHYSMRGLVDLWHWKAVRTNYMGLMDDNYIAEPDIVRAGHRRYTAGYQTDAKQSGSYTMNWQWYSPQKVTPKRLPIDPKWINDYQKPALRTATNGFLPWFDTAPYEAEKDIYPVGTLLPSILYTSNQFEGDRADVRAKAHWQDGIWSLEIFRQLNTGSANDTVIENDVCFWFAAFDRSQIAHTRHSLPVKIELAQ